MCGIAVHFNSLGRAKPLDLGLIHHRGPDSSGEWLSTDGHCWLGNTRLAIVEISHPLRDKPTGKMKASKEGLRLNQIRLDPGSGKPFDHHRRESLHALLAISGVITD